MTNDRFVIFWSWTPRIETPEQTYGRMTKSIEALGAISPEIRSWKVIDMAQGFQSLLGGRNAIMPAPKNAAMGEPSPPKGFMVLAAKDLTAWPEGMAMVCAGAGRMTFPGMVGLTFKTASAQADPGLISYPVFQRIMMSLVPIWDCTFAQAYTSQLREHMKGGEPFGASWITYLSPSLSDIDPPEGVMMEDTPGYGLLLSAAQDTFDVRNPSHMAAAQSLQTALAPLNRKLRL
jgi:hypothetical protein